MTRKETNNLKVTTDDVGGRGKVRHFSLPVHLRDKGRPQNQSTLVSWREEKERSQPFELLLKGAKYIKTLFFSRVLLWFLVVHHLEKGVLYNILLCCTDSHKTTQRRGGISPKSMQNISGTGRKDVVGE